MARDPEQALLSDNPIEVTHYLTNRYLDEIGTEQPETATLLRKYRDLIWPLKGEPTSAETKAKAIEAMIRAGDGHDYETQKNLLTGLMRFGQFYDVAAIVARGNAFDKNRKERGEDRVSDSTGGVENLFETVIEKQKAKLANADPQYQIPFEQESGVKSTVLKDALTALSHPIFEVVMTTHPTNVNALASLEQMRNLHKAIHTFRKSQEPESEVEKEKARAELNSGARDSIRASIAGLTKADAIPMVQKNGEKVPGNISVRGEVNMVLFYLKSMYDDLPQVYRGFEEPIKRLQRKGLISAEEEYKPLDLKLNIRASAWGLSGDKDGNKNVNADTTLEALLATKVTLLDLYLDEMHRLPEGAQAKLQGRIELFTQRRDAYAGALEKVEGYVEKGNFLPPQVFDDIVAGLPKVPKDELKTFIGELENIYNETGSNRVLALTRRVRSFGYHFAKIEYRETAEEYARVVAEIDPAYKTLHEKSLETKAELDALENKVKLAAQRTALLEQFASLEKAFKQLGSSSNPREAIGSIYTQLRQFGKFVDPDDQIRQAEEISPQPDELPQDIAAQKQVLAQALAGVRKSLADLKAPVDVEDDKQRLQTTLEELEGKKRSFLTEALAKDSAKTMLANKWPVIKEGAEKPYDKETDVPRNALPISYQTIKRMELAREFPEMITANVLAECQNTSNILEAVFLQSACTDKDGKRPIMGVVPLFEEPDTMQRVTEIMGDAYRNEEYKKHMQKVADRLGEMGWTDGALRQQVQIAHSDNARRSGFLAARAFIDEAHKQIRALNEAQEPKIVTEFFEGGSISDAYRGGVRSISAAVNEYGLHDFMKFTFQGGDLPNYFGSPGSTVRLFTRNIAHAAKQFLGNVNGATKEPTETEANIPSYNHIAQEALKGTLKDYQRNIFTKEAMGNFMKYAVDPYGNVGSRAGARGGAAQTDPDKVRTIGFSEMFQHAGVLPTWLGASTLAQNLCKKILVMQRQGAGLYSTDVKIHMPDVTGKGTEDTFFVPKDGTIARLDPKVYGIFYDKSAVFRNAVDGMAFGLALSDIDGLKKNYPMLKDDPFVARLEKDYRAAAHIVLGALHEEPSERQQISSSRSKARKETDAGMIALDPATPLAELRERIRERLPHLKPAMEHKTDIFNAAAGMKANWRRDWEWEAAKEEAEAKGQNFEIPKKDDIQHGWMMHLAHGAIDSVTHGRYLMADDPMYMRMLFPKYHEARSQRRSLDHGDAPPVFHIQGLEGPKSPARH